MRRIHSKILQACLVIIGLVCGLSAVGSPASTRADAVGAPSLVISQLKMTSSNGQFITLYNPTGATLDMSKYQLEYFNSYDLAKATSSRLIALAGNLPPHGYFMVSDDSTQLCYTMTVDSNSLGLSSTAGMVEVLNFGQASPGSSVTPVLQDYAAWSKTAAAGAQTLPAATNAFLMRQPLDAQSNPSISAPGAGSWQAVQPDANNPCKLVTSGAGTSAPVQTGMNDLLPGSEPPVTFVGGSDNPSTGTGALPSDDEGLMTPVITELLPNPLGTGNDASDEYIELYNPNNIPFNLSSFALQVGTTSLHTFTFPAGVSLPAQTFTAFYSADTGLSLSNTGGQARLLDPLGNVMSQSDVYGTAKDGQAWARANGAWFWTIRPTPGSANVISGPIPAKQSAAASSPKKSAATKIRTSKIKAPKKTKIKSLSGSSPASDTAPVTPIHTWTLALVASLALLYVAYEYRSDLANRIRQSGRDLGSRAPHWAKIAWRRSFRASE